MVGSRLGKLGLVGGLWVRFAGLVLQSNIMAQLANQSLHWIERAYKRLGGEEISTTSILDYSFEESSQTRKEIMKVNVVLNRYYT